LDGIRKTDQIIMMQKTNHDRFPSYLALIHYPVLNKIGDTITSAVTNLDLHDISRACKTYGIDSFFVVTPDADQQEIVQKLTDYWVRGKGSRLNPDRKSALELIQLVNGLDEVISIIYKKTGKLPLVIATSAGYKGQVLQWHEAKDLISGAEGSLSRPILFLFGTAFGLSKDIYDSVDMILAPIKGVADYNHLSVRCAVAIVLDRLFNQLTI